MSLLYLSSDLTGRITKAYNGAGDGDKFKAKIGFLVQTTLRFHFKEETGLYPATHQHNM